MHVSKRRRRRRRKVGGQVFGVYQHVQH